MPRKCWQAQSICNQAGHNLADSQASHEFLRNCFITPDSEIVLPQLTNCSVSQLSL
jgi:hypothetical protein